MHALGKDSKQWETVHVLSRSQKEEHPFNVTHDTIDLTGDAKEIAKQLKDVEAEYVFFATYLQKDSEQESWDVNGAMLKTLLEALDITGASKRIKRTILTTGAKRYDLHLGCPKKPMGESDPWIEGEGRPPNFYYHKQRILAEAGKKAT